MLVAPFRYSLEFSLPHTTHFSATFAPPPLREVSCVRACAQKKADGRTTRTERLWKQPLDPAECFNLIVHCIVHVDIPNNPQDQKAAFVLVLGIKT